jgi:peptide/nickel transport system ATP-binding protein
VTRVALEVEQLRVEVEGWGIDIVDEVSFAVPAGDVLGLVGESGSGKTTAGLAVLGHTRRGAKITGGEIRIEGRNVLVLPRSERQQLRGKLVSYVPQDPASALNPALRIGKQLEETLTEHGFGKSGEERRARIVEVLGEVLLPSDEAFLRRYPHQLSGGQQQRVALGMAFANRPRVIVLDEPTTGLDVTTQAHVLATVRDLCDAHGVAAVYVSHDLSVVATLATQVAVMYSGRIVEIGPTRTLFRQSAHPYTRRLVEAIPELSGKHALVGIPGTAPRPGSRPQGCHFAARCAYVVDACLVEFPPVETVAHGHDVRCYRHQVVLEESMAARPAAPELTPPAEDVLVAVRGVSASHGTRQVLFDIDLAVRPHECVALVGESGSGKTTLARCIAGLHANYQGEISFRGEPLSPGARARNQSTRREIQYVFQSPYSSLNPRKTIGQIVDQPLQLFYPCGREVARTRIVDALESVQLSASVMNRYPHQLSGGERQRAAIARALIANPQLLVCDEVTSALDVSVQAAIIDVLAELQRELGIGLLFVTHNLALIRTLSQEVVVMSEGRIVERGLVDRVLDDPQANYTKKLLSDTPSLEAAMAAAS